MHSEALKIKDREITDLIGLENAGLGIDRPNFSKYMYNVVFNLIAVETVESRVAFKGTGVE